MLILWEVQKMFKEMNNEEIMKIDDEGVLAY
jgi:hypothetical protein